MALNGLLDGGSPDRIQSPVASERRCHSLRSPRLSQGVGIRAPHPHFPVEQPISIQSQRGVISLPEEALKSSTDKQRNGGRRKYKSNDNFTAFDREMIRCARDLVPVEIYFDPDEAFERSNGQTVLIIVVDRYFIKVQQRGSENKSLWVAKNCIAAVVEADS